MSIWVPLGGAEDFPEGSQQCVRAGEKELIVFRVHGTFYALRNLCPHAGLPLDGGARRELVLTCPFHGYAFNIKTGLNVDWPHDEPPARTYPTRVREGRLEVRMESPDVSKQKRGPAPDDHPSDEKPDLAESGEPLTKPQAPSGYPDEEQQIPQLPPKTDAKPKPEPTREGN